MTAPEAVPDATRDPAAESAPEASPDAAPDSAVRAKPSRRFILIALLVCLLIAGGLSLLASASPDGLSRVAENSGFARTAQDTATANSPLANYQVGSTEDSWSRSLAGLAGVMLTGAVAVGLFLWVGRRR